MTDVQHSFEQFWNSTLSVPVTSLVHEAHPEYIDPHRFDRLHQYACNPDNFWPQVRERITKIPEAFVEIQRSGRLVWTDSVTFVSDNPGKNIGRSLHGGGHTTETLAGLIAHAQHTLDIQSPYLIVTDEGLELLKAAVKRGVKIRILTNSLASNDNLSSFGGYQKVRKSLLDAGVHIFEFKPNAKGRDSIMTGALKEKPGFKPIFGLHAKSMVIDGKITAIGTFNMDPRSANLNTECATIITSEKIAAGVLKGMEEEFKPENSWETTLTFNPDSTAGKARRAGTWIRKAIPKAIL